MAAKVETVDGEAVVRRNKAIVAALCRSFSVDQANFPSEAIAGYDIMNLFSSILQLYSIEIPVNKKEEVMKWVSFSSSFPYEASAAFEALRGLNEKMLQYSVLLDDGLSHSEADIVVFCAIYNAVSQLNDADLQTIPNLMRWMDYIQSKEDFAGEFGILKINKPKFEPHLSNLKIEDSQRTKKAATTSSNVNKNAEKRDGNKISKKINSENIKVDVNASFDESAVSLKNVDKSEGNKSAKNVISEQATPDSKKVVEVSLIVDEKKKPPESSLIEKDVDGNIAILNIQIGIIRKAWKHPSADSLLVEEIDLGEGKLRQVVSGLAKYCSADELTNRLVVLITNVKPGKLRDVTSAGLVLCASNEDHTIVEPLKPPEGAIIGERVSFLGYEGKPEEVLNPKKKQLEKIMPHLYTDGDGVATYKGVPFMTSVGPCKSSLPKASIK